MRLLQKLFALTIVAMAVTVHAQDKGYDVTSYDVNLHIDRVKNYLEGAVTMHARATREIQSCIQHLLGLNIDSIFVKRTKTGYTVTDSGAGEYTVNLPMNLGAGDEFTVLTYYHGAPMNEGGSNPWGGVTNNNSMMFAMGVGFSAPFISTTRYWMPCYDEPDDKADSATLTFTTPESDVVASNGLRIMDSVNALTHTRTTVWHVSHPIASYLLTFAVGPFVELNIAGPAGTPIQAFSHQSDSAKLDYVLRQRIVQTIALYDSLFGPYPFEKVGYVVAPIGSMEHQTMITLINQAIDTNSTTPQHELAHMWWGDWVTCKDFNDPWLNEGFATFCESLVLEHDVSTARYWQKQKANITGAISNGSTNAMYGAPFRTSPRDNYPYAVIYQKGAAVLGMLRYMLGDSIFFPALRAYGNAHRYGNATSYDLQHDLEQFTGQDLHWFFKQWVFGTWYPQIKVSYSRAGASYTLNLQQVQDPAKYQYFRVPFVVEARTKGGITDRTVVWMDSVAFTTVNVFCAFPPDTIVVDPDGAIIKKITSVTTLDVPPTQPVSMDICYSVQFMPNPSKSTTPKLVVSALPFVHTDLFDETTYQLQRLNELTGGSAELLLFDSNGHKVVGGPLSRPESVSRRGNDVSYVFGLPFAPLSSGTYFAKVVLNNTVVGEAQLVVTK